MNEIKKTFGSLRKNPLPEKNKQAFNWERREG